MFMAYELNVKLSRMNCFIGCCQLGNNLNKSDLEDLVNFLEEAKIQTRSYFTGNALLHPAYSKFADKYEDPSGAFPVATKSTRDTFFMGVYPGITEEQMDYIEKNFGI